MRVAIWPFCSQIDKTAGLHLIDSCGACKQLSFVADQIRDDLKCEVVVAIPESRKAHNLFGLHEIVDVTTAKTNPVQRIHWDAMDIRRVLRGCDIAILNHEYMAIPARVVNPKLKIIQMCSVLPDSPLFAEAWRNSDLVVAQGDYAAKYIRGYTPTPVVPWKLAYDERAFVDRPAADRDIDVYFIQRCSATNYTHHEEFIEAMKLLNGVNFTFADVTGYLQQKGEQYNYSSPSTYIDTLHRSRVAIALNDNLYGGLSIREAIRAGCIPVVLNAPCYRELVGENYPYMIDDPTPKEIATVLNAALSNRPEFVSIDESYQSAWPGIRKNLLDLLTSSILGPFGSYRSSSGGDLSW